MTTDHKTVRRNKIGDAHVLAGMRFAAAESLEAMAEESVAKSQAGYVGGEAARVARIADQRIAKNPARHTLGEALAEAIKKEVQE